MSELSRFGNFEDNRRSSILPMSQSRRTVACYNQQDLELRAGARLEERKEQLRTEFVENRIMDVHEVATFAQAAMQTDLDRALILPIVQAYGMGVQRSVMNYGKGL